MIESWFIDCSLKGKGIEMKVKYICWNAPHLTKDKVYEVFNDSMGMYGVVNDIGERVYWMHKRFEVVEEMEIKVGNKYIHDNGTICELTFVSARICVGVWESNGLDFSIAIDDLRKWYKPYIPVRTVWLNVYDIGCVAHDTKEEADASKLQGCLYQQEVILQNPDEVK